MKRISPGPGEYIIDGVLGNQGVKHSIGSEKRLNNLQKAYGKIPGPQNYKPEHGQTL